MRSRQQLLRHLLPDMPSFIGDGATGEEIGMILVLRTRPRFVYAWPSQLGQDKAEIRKDYARKQGHMHRRKRVIHRYLISTTVHSFSQSEPISQSKIALFGLIFAFRAVSHASGQCIYFGLIHIPLSQVRASTIVLLHYI